MMRLLVLALVLVFSSNSFGSTDDLRSRISRWIFGKSTISPYEKYVRTQAVLHYFGSPDEGNSQAFLNDLSSLQTYENIRAQLKYFDPTGQFTSFADLRANQLIAYKDPNSKKILDFSLPLSIKSRFSPRDIKKYQSLNGLRIAIDPGHMGGNYWDGLTGKFTHDDQEHFLSEGTLALQAALLLEARLKQYGAQVLLTRRTLGPVTNLKFDQIDVGKWAQFKLKDQTLLPWFQNLISKFPVGEGLYNGFQADKSFQKLFSEDMRKDYFVSVSDLGARAQIINEFQPQITLVIHFDTHEPPNDPTALSQVPYDFVKTYVAGAFEPQEFASRKSRRLFVRHMADPEHWRESIKLSRSIVQNLKTTLGIRAESVSAGTTVLIEDGVMTRNLFLTREIYGTALSYVECLYYNDPIEFSLLGAQDHTINIDDKLFSYSNRLVQVVDGLESGILAFVRK